MDHVPIPLSQSPTLAAACQDLGLPVQVIPRAHAPPWVVHSRRFRGFGPVHLISRAVQIGADDLDRTSGAGLRRDMVLITPDQSGPDLWGAGFWPLVTPATVAEVPLHTPAKMRAALSGKWRNRLRRAEAAGLSIRCDHSLRDTHWLLGQAKADAQAKGYHMWPTRIAVAFARRAPDQTLVIEARHKGRLVSAALVLRHGAMATWHLAQSTPEGRHLNAMNLTLWTALERLADLGHRWLDLGTVNSRDAPGLLRFKLGAGAQLRPLGETWGRHKALAPFAKMTPRVFRAPRLSVP